MILEPFSFVHRWEGPYFPAPPGNRLVTGSLDRSVRLWQRIQENWTCLRSMCLGSSMESWWNGMRIFHRKHVEQNMKKPRVSINFFKTVQFDIYTCFGQARLVYISYIGEVFEVRYSHFRTPSRLIFRFHALLFFGTSLNSYYFHI